VSKDVSNSKSATLLEVKNIVKMFGDLAANDDISLSIRQGEIHALLGENGAGKSTLVKIIYGSLQPTSGEIFWRGRRVDIPNPSAARDLGIGMVFQHFSLFESLSVVENIALALPGKFDLKALTKRIIAVSQDYGLPLEPSALIADLSVGQRQRIEIVRCLLQEPQLLIMDEPTAVLTPQESEQLFKTLNRLAGEGCAILYISHRLDEIQQLCDEATILRQGRVVANVDPKAETAKSLARLMVGSEILNVTSRKAKHGAALVMAVSDVSAPAIGQFGVELKNINLDVYAGEIVSIAGVAGNGQSELFEVLSGERTEFVSGTICLNGEDVTSKNIIKRRALDAAFVPEERLGLGAVPEFSLSDNIILTRHSTNDGILAGGILNSSVSETIQNRVSTDLDIRKGEADPQASSLSGGNLQKFVVGRELDRAPKLLVINQPTWGVDAGAAARIHQALLDLADAGSAVLVISQDLDEIYAISDRIAVISRGQLSPASPTDEMSLEQIGLLMAGAHEKAPVQMEMQP